MYLMMMTGKRKNFIVVESKQYEWGARLQWQFLELSLYIVRMRITYVTGVWWTATVVGFVKI